MATAHLVRIPDRFTCRGITFLPNGQQFSLGLPPGEYDDLGECDVVYTDLGTVKRGRANMLVNTLNGEKWYVGVEVAKSLHAEHPASR